MLPHPRSLLPAAPAGKAPAGPQSLSRALAQPARASWSRPGDPRSTSTTNEGAPFANRYCWVCRFDGDTIVEVRAYLDSAMVAYTVSRNENGEKAVGTKVKSAPSAAPEPAAAGMGSPSAPADL